MWKSWKFIVPVALVAVMLIAGTAGVVVARDNEHGSHHKASLAEVAEILGVEQEDLQAAFDQVRGEMRGKYRDSGQHEALLAEVAEILGVELQELQDAFDQVRQSCDEMRGENRDGERPFKHPFGRGHDGPRCDDHATE